MRQIKRIALITGGQGDLAQESARALEAQNWRVLTPSRHEFDVRVPESVRAYLAGISRLDYIICAAGVLADRPLARMKEQDWEQVWTVNYEGVLHCLRASWGLLTESQGSVALIGSHAGAQGRIAQVAYVAAKAALEGLCESYARQGAEDGVRVNLVLPGFLETKMTAGMVEKRRQALRLEHLLGEFNSLENAAAFLAQLPEWRHCSGQTFALDSRLLA